MDEEIVIRHRDHGYLAEEGELFTVDVNLALLFPDMDQVDMFIERYLQQFTVEEFAFLYKAAAVAEGSQWDAALMEDMRG